MDGRTRSSRGRAKRRTPTLVPAEGAARPGAPPATAQVGPPLGRARGVAPRQVPSAPGMPQGAAAVPPSQPRQQPVASSQPSLVQEMACLDVKSGNGNGNGNGNGGDLPVGRGGVRGRREQCMELVRTRPDHITSKQGTTGRVIQLMANYFEVLKRPEWTLVQYRVDFSPEEDRTSVRKGMLRACKDRLGGDYIFDGTVLYMNRRLENDRLETCCERATDQAKIQVTVRMVGELQPSDHMYLQVFNILLRRTMGHLNLEEINRHFYDRHASIKLSDFNLELWPGYITSIRQHEHKLLLCTEIHHKVLRQDTVLSQLYAFYNQDSRNYQKMAAEALLGTIVMTRYNSKTYRIDDIDWNKSPQDTFPKRDLSEISYIEYYKQRYGEIVKDMRQPLLVSRPRKKDVHRGEVECVYLLPELCCMTGLDQNMRENFQLMKAMGQHTHQGPDKKVMVLQRFMSRIHSEPKCMAELSGFQLDFSNKLIEFQGRMLEPEGIVLGNNKKASGGPQADWTCDLRSNPMLKVVPLHNWAVIAPERSRRDLPGFLQTLSRAASGMSFNMQEPQIVYLTEVRPQQYVTAIDECYSNMSPQMVMIILGTNRKDLYGAVKKRCYVERGMASQVVVARNMTSKGVMSIATKIAIQMNCKLGGEPWPAEIPLKNCMMVGFDVYHNTAQKGTSVGALVASMNPVYTRYYSTVAIHRHQEELSNFISTNMVQALRKYQTANGKLPSQIILYRDGVGEGQIGYVKDHELVQVKASLATVYGGDSFKFAFIIVNKRLNTRIMTAQQGNPLPGTIVDDIITLPERYDFYLISQTVRQGTVSPTSYSVIDDSLNLEPDKIQRLTYKMGHLYFNWSGTVRVPAPCQYAHKLAYLVGEYIHSDVHPDMSDTLFFL